MLVNELLLEIKVVTFSVTKQVEYRSIPATDLFEIFDGSNFEPRIICEFYHYFASISGFLATNTVFLCGFEQQKSYFSACVSVTETQNENYHGTIEVALQT